MQAQFALERAQDPGQVSPEETDPERLIYELTVVQGHQDSNPGLGALLYHMPSFHLRLKSPQGTRLT